MAFSMVELTTRITPAANCFGRELDRLPLEPLGDKAACSFQIEGEVSAEKALRLEPAEKQIGVGDRRLGAASVADGSGIGSGGLRTDSKRSGGVEAGDGTSAGANGVNVEHGHADRQAGNLSLTARLDFAIDQGHVGGGAAHVEGNDAVESAAAGHGRSADYAAGGTGEHGAHWFARRGCQAGDSAARLHHEDSGLARAGLARPSGTAFEALQIALHHRLQVRIHHDRAGALVFAELGKNLM